MTGAAIQVDVRGFIGVQQVLGRLVNIFRRQKLLAVIGSVIETSTVERIAKDKQGPLGEVWPPLQDWYRDWKSGVSSGGLLELRGHLRDSIMHKVSGDTLEVGTNVEYAATHQFGDDRLAWGSVKAHYPARPFLGLSDKDQDEIEDIVQEFVARVMAK